jgi:hypothetical protein
MKTTYSDGEIVERGGYRFRVNYPNDEDHEAPWNDGDGQGIVIEPNRYTQAKKPGWRVLHSGDRWDKWYFDWQGTIAKAKLEGWGLGPEGIAALAWKLKRDPTPGEINEEAVEQNFQWMRGFLRDDWWYCAIIITHLPDPDDDTVPRDYHPDHACWGFDTSSPEYIAEETDSMIDNYIGELDTMAAQERREEEAAALERERLDDEAREAVVLLWKEITNWRFGQNAPTTANMLAALEYLAGRVGTPYPPQ